MTHDDLQARLNEISSDGTPDAFERRSSERRAQRNEANSPDYYLIGLILTNALLLTLIALHAS